VLPWPQEVMLARLVDELPATGSLPGGCLFEPKWDGFRALVHVLDTGDRTTVARVQSRRAVDLTSAFPDIADAAAAQLPPGTVLDGELVIWDPVADRLDFGALQQRMASRPQARHAARSQPATFSRPASFVAFDLLAHDGQAWTDRPLRERRRRLEALVPDLRPPLQVTPATRDRDVAAEWMRQHLQAGTGIEGLVVKGLGEPYVGGRRGWVKVKPRETAEAVVGAVTGPLHQPDRLILGLYEDDELILAGVTVDLTPQQRDEIAPLLQLPVAGEHPWPLDLPSTGLSWGRTRAQPVTLVQPTVVVEILADAAVHGSRWRHGVRLRRARPDLDPHETTVPGR
jgi:ATP-dependent DNA ligase